MTLAPAAIRSASRGAGTVPPPRIWAEGSQIAGGSGSGAAASRSVVCGVIGRDAGSPLVWGSGLAFIVAGSAMTWMSTAEARGSVSSAAAQSGVPQRQASWVPSAARVPSASARRWARVRGSLSQTSMCHRGQLAVQHHGVGSQQGAPQMGGAAVVVRRGDDHLATAGANAGAAQRGGVVAVDDLVDGRGGLGRRERPEALGVVGQRGVDSPQHFGVFDQVGTPDDGAGQPGVNDAPGRTGLPRGAADPAVPPPDTSGRRPTCG